ncbi:hypothetical protein K1719_005157 [Acacia pycnantha]|nr:hypothetical protein K1719_005157 [Acacia pycnantha]
MSMERINVERPEKMKEAVTAYIYLLLQEQRKKSPTADFPTADKIKIVLRKWRKTPDDESIEYFMNGVKGKKRSEAVDYAEATAGQAKAKIARANAPTIPPANLMVEKEKIQFQKVDSHYDITTPLISNASCFYLTKPRRRRNI